MYVLLIVLSVLAAILLICVILIQKSKGGGLASSFASSNQIMGVRRTNSFIEKLTWGLGIAIAVLAIFSSFLMPSAITTTSRVQPQAQEQTAPGNFDQNAPAAPEAASPEAPAPAPAAPAE